jgi:hypothetical protein
MKIKEWSEIKRDWMENAGLLALIGGVYMIWGGTGILCMLIICAAFWALAHITAVVVALLIMFR